MGLRKKLKKFLYINKFKKKNLVEGIYNKNILITGANSGIGLALSKKLLSLDNLIIATYKKNFDKLEKIDNKNLFKVEYDQAKNIKEFNSLDKKLKDTQIDIVINCAGVFGPSFKDQEIENLNIDNFKEVLLINSLSIVGIIQKILNNYPPELIINISSDAGSISKNDQGNAYIYRASKTALNSITRNMSVDLNRRFGTCVFAIDPGNVESGMNPSGHLKSEDCANLIIDLISLDVKKLNGKFVNLLRQEIPW